MANASDDFNIFDQNMEYLAELHSLVDTDKENYCKGVRNLDRNNRTFRPYYEEELNLLDEKINSNSYDLEALRAAQKIFDTISLMFHESPFTTTRNQYLKTIKKRLRNYKISLNLLAFTQQIVQYTAIIGGVLIPSILIFSGLPKQVPSIIGLLVAAAGAVIKWGHLSEKKVSVSNIFVKTQKEYELYISGRGEYKWLKKGAALHHFMDKMDELRDEQHAFSISMEKTTQEQLMKEQVQKVEQKKSRKSLRS